MVNEQYIDLIIKLAEKTKSKTVKWQKSSGDGEFKLQLTVGTLTVKKYDGDFNNRPSVYINIYNDKGDIIDSIDIEDNVAEFQIANELYSLIRRVYYKVDETLNSIFNELNSDKVIGFDEPEEEDLPF